MNTIRSGADAAALVVAVRAETFGVDFAIHVALQTSLWLEAT